MLLRFERLIPAYQTAVSKFIVDVKASAVNVLVTQTREALYGANCFAAGFPVFLLMRRVSRRQAPVPPAPDEPER